MLIQFALIKPLCRFSYETLSLKNRRIINAILQCTFMSLGHIASFMFQS